MKRDYKSPEIKVACIHNAQFVCASLPRGKDKDEVELNSKAFWGTSEFEEDEEEYFGEFID